MSRRAAVGFALLFPVATLAQDEARLGPPPDRGLVVVQQLLALDARGDRIAWLAERIDTLEGQPALLERVTRAHAALVALDTRDEPPEQDALFLRAALDPDPERGQAAVEAARQGGRPALRRPEDPAAGLAYAQDFLWVRHYAYVDNQMSYIPSVGSFAVFLDLPDVVVRGWDVRQGDGTQLRSQDFARLSDDLAFLEGLQASQRRARRAGWPLVGAGAAMLGGSMPPLVHGIEGGDTGPMVLGTSLFCAGVTAAVVGARVLVQDEKRQREVGYSKLIGIDEAGAFIEQYDLDLAERLGLDPWEVVGLEHEAVREAVFPDQSE
jgi:hypothetical protein